MNLTVEMLLKAKEILCNPPRSEPIYVAPEWVHENPEYLDMFTKSAQSFHPFETVTVVKQQRIGETL